MGEIDLDSQDGALILEHSRGRPTNPGWRIVAEILAAAIDEMQAAAIDDMTPDQLDAFLRANGKIRVAKSDQNAFKLNQTGPNPLAPPHTS